jgi:hypothetical protein
MMDLWLALHSPSPYEFFAGAERRMRQDPSDSQWRFRGAAYASIFGLELQHGAAGDLGAAETLGLFDLRVFGYHQQGTNITLQAGLRSREVGGAGVRSGLGGVAMTIYLARQFGIDGYWRHFFAPVPNAAGLAATGSRWEAGAFIDFSFLRVYGDWYNEQVERFEKGATAGLRVYF